MMSWAVRPSGRDTWRRFIGCALWLALCRSVSALSRELSYRTMEAAGVWRCCDFAEDRGHSCHTAEDTGMHSWKLTEAPSSPGRSCIWPYMWCEQLGRLQLRYKMNHSRVHISPAWRTNSFLNLPLILSYPLLSREGRSGCSIGSGPIARYCNRTKRSRHRASFQLWEQKTGIDQWEENKRSFEA